MGKIRLGLFVGASTALLAGCVTLPPGQGGMQGQSAAMGEPLPEFVIGEKFIFDDKRSETVIAIDGDVVTWQTSNGVTRSSYKNPMLPYLRWWGDGNVGRIEGNVTPTTLWPIRQGLHVRYWTYVFESQPGRSEQRYTQDWECSVEAKAKTTVPAGTFDTRKVTCYRTYSGYLRQTRTFHYAPSLGYYVSRHDESISNGTSDRKLVAHEFDTSVLPDTDKKALVAQVQSALSRGETGKTASWQDSSKRVSVRIIPSEIEKQGPEGKTCRSYDGVFTVSGKTITNHRRACLGKNGVWLTA